MTRWSSSRVVGPASVEEGGRGPGGGTRTPRKTPVSSGWSLPRRMASMVRAPNTNPSSSEFDASRFAPWTPEQAASPQAHNPGSVEAPSRSVQMPPDR